MLSASEYMPLMSSPRYWVNNDADADVDNVWSQLPGWLPTTLIPGASLESSASNPLSRSIVGGAPGGPTSATMLPLSPKPLALNALTMARAAASPLAMSLGPVYAVHRLVSG